MNKMERAKRNLIEEDLKRMSKVFMNAADPILIEDPEGYVIEMNDEAVRSYGWSREELVGRPIKTIVPPERHGQADDLLARCKAGEEMRNIEGLRCTKQGAIIPVLLTLSLLKDEDGQIIGVATLAKDISAQKRVESELQRYRDHLEEQIKERTLELSEAKELAEQATQAKSDFLANMSHEIRTPMNAIIGMAHLALKTKLTPKQHDYLDKIQSSANSLLGIINDILDFSKIEAGKLDIEAVNFNLEDVLENLGNLISVKAQEKQGLEVLFATDADVPRFLKGDPLRLGQVLLNLSGNAVKFTEEGEIVIATAVKSKTDEALVLQFTVRDTGIGMTEQQIDKLFQSFSQADTSTTRKFGGTGLGVTSSKSLVEMMGGEIWVESTPGKGSQFHFTVMLGRGADKTKRQFYPRHNLRGLKVLVVDDNAKSRHIFGEMLESFTFDVHLTASGQEALSEIESAIGKPFDLVIMDWKMPGMDGIEASKRIKTHTGLVKTPAIIMVTAYGREEVMRLSDEVGLDGYLLKPVNASVLFDAVMEAMGEKEVLGEHERKHAVAKKVFSLKAGTRVLLAEDNEINQQVAQEILEGAGFKVTIANNGQEAVEMMKSSHFEIVLMDIQMPVMDGYAATKAIRDWEKSQDQSVPIIAMTAHAMSGDREKSIKTGMNGHVTKPIDPDLLFAEIEKWISPGEEQSESTCDIATTVNGADPVLLETLDGFDIADGLQRLQGNRSLYRKLILKFADNCRNSIAQINTAIESQNYNGVLQASHNIKGSAGNLGAKPLESAAMALKHLVRKNPDSPPPIDTIKGKFEKLKCVADKMFKAIETLGEAGEKASTKGGDVTTGIPKEHRMDLALRIKDAAEMGDMTELQTIAEELYRNFGDQQSLSKRIIDLVDAFDLDGLAILAESLNSSI